MDGGLPDWQALAPGEDSPAFDAAQQAALDGRGLIVVLSTPAAHDAGWASDLAIQLTEAWSARHSPVRLVDFSLERPDLHRKLEIELGEGIVDAVEYGASLDRVVRATPRGIDLISAGTLAIDSESLCVSKRWAGLCGELAKPGGVVVYAPLDLPGTEHLSDAADAVILVADPSFDSEVTAHLRRAPLAVIGRPVRAEAPAAEIATEPPKPSLEDGMGRPPEGIEEETGGGELEWTIAEQPGLDDVLNEVDLDLGLLEEFGVFEAVAESEDVAAREKAGGPLVPEADANPDTGLDRAWTDGGDEVALTGGWDPWDGAFGETPPEEDLSETPASTGAPEAGGAIRAQFGPPGWDHEFDDLPAGDEGAHPISADDVPLLEGLVGPGIDRLTLGPDEADERLAEGRQDGDPLPSTPAASPAARTAAEGVGAPVDRPARDSPPRMADGIGREVESLPLRSSRSPIPKPRREPDKAAFPLTRVVLLFLLFLILLAIGMGWLQIPGLGAEPLPSLAMVFPSLRRSIQIQ